MGRVRHFTMLLNFMMFMSQGHVYWHRKKKKKQEKEKKKKKQVIWFYKWHCMWCTGFLVRGLVIGTLNQPVVSGRATHSGVCQCSLHTHWQGFPKHMGINLWWPVHSAHWPAVFHTHTHMHTYAHTHTHTHTHTQKCYKDITKDFPHGGKSLTSHVL